MTSSCAERVVALAVTRYGADRVRAVQVYQMIRQGSGQAADLLDRLVTEGILTAEQAGQIRRDLDVTQMDPARASDTQPDALFFLEPELRCLGEFRILRRLGEGGMGAVYLGYHEGQACQVAIKVLADHLASNRASVDRFYREARIGALLDHPHIVRGITAGQDRIVGKHYIVLEFVDGTSAHVLLERFGRLTVPDAVRITLDIARALEYLSSRDFVHRDIKPDNILITRSGVSKLADLGLAKRIGETSHLTALHQGFGTPYYMPYEQAMSARRVDGRSDIYALGATLYHLVTGEVPFPGENYQEIVEKKAIGRFALASTLNPEVPAGLDRILARTLAREPRDRYQSATELIHDLERSHLARAVPSFVELDPALQEELVETHLTLSNQPTRPSLAAGAAQARSKFGSRPAPYTD
jgi:serine/threonine-protein kinase